MAPVPRWTPASAGVIGLTGPVRTQSFPRRRESTGFHTGSKMRPSSPRRARACPGPTHPPDKDSDFHDLSRAKGPNGQTLEAPPFSNPSEKCRLERSHGSRGELSYQSLLSRELAQCWTPRRAKGGQIVGYIHTRRRSGAGCWKRLDPWPRSCDSEPHGAQTGRFCGPRTSRESACLLHAICYSNVTTGMRQSTATAKLRLQLEKYRLQRL